MPRSPEEIQQLVTSLGKAFTANGREDQAKELRLYFLALSKGLTRPDNALSLEWSERACLEWLGLYQVPPYHLTVEARPAPSRCTKCQAKSAEDLGPLPKGRGYRCDGCQTVWLELAA